MSDHLDGRVDVLESIAAICEVKFRAASTIDDFMNRRAGLAALDDLLSQDYRWQWGGHLSLKGLQEYRSFVTRCSSAVSLSMQLLSNGVVDIDEAGTSASGEWVIWQPFTWREEAWVMAGRSKDFFYRQGLSWILASTRVNVEVMSPWAVGWGDTPICQLPGIETVMAEGDAV